LALYKVTLDLRCGCTKLVSRAVLFGEIWRHGTHRRSDGVQRLMPPGALSVRRSECPDVKNYNQKLLSVQNI